MYAPHMIALVNTVESDSGAVSAYVTYIAGVFLDKSKSRGMTRNGVTDTDLATLYIPFSAKGTDKSGRKKEYKAPKAFEALSSKTGYWTIHESGKASGQDCFFIGISEISDIDETVLTSYQQAKRTYDSVYAVSAINIRDFGSEDMRHFQITGK